MLTVASLFCGFIISWELLISGMVQPAKVLGFLDIFETWDPSLAYPSGSKHLSPLANTARIRAQLLTPHYEGQSHGRDDEPRSRELPAAR